jgi:hypothetical protein
VARAAANTTMLSKLLDTGFAKRLAATDNKCLARSIVASV